MNKTKVMQILNSIDSGLNDIEENQQPVMQVLTEYVRADVKDLKEEINSKPVMPNFFDRWIKENGRNEYLLVFCLSRFLATWVTYGDNETDIREWVYADPYRFNMCIDAILNGYVVEK